MAEKNWKGLELWEKVEKTNPKFTKTVAYGKRKFTTIDAYYQIKMATELFGPYGSGWGIKDTEMQFIEIGDSKMALYKGTFYYPGGEFPIYNSIFIRDDEWAKKLETDTLTKALSRLGFNADVFMGLFDDNRYVQNLKKEMANGSSGGSAGKPAEKPEKPSSTSTEEKQSPEEKKMEEVEKALKPLGLSLENGIVKGKTYGKGAQLKQLGFMWDSKRSVWHLPGF